jgi:HSP20 family protein
MALVRFDPFRGFESAIRRMSDFFEDAEKGQFSLEYGNFSPRIDIIEDKDVLTLYAEMPGIKKDNVNVKINDENILTITGEKHAYKFDSDEADDKKGEEKEAKVQKSFIKSERSFGSFVRRIMLPENIDADSINAKFADGVLEITLTKKEPEKPKEKAITIN